MELHNSLSKDLHFKDVKIDIEPADKMTDNEKYAFVREHFEAHFLALSFLEINLQTNVE